MPAGIAFDFLSVGRLQLGEALIEGRLGGFFESGVEAFALAVEVQFRAAVKDGDGLLAGKRIKELSLVGSAVVLVFVL